MHKPATETLHPDAAMPVEAKEHQAETALSPLERLGTIPKETNLSPEKQAYIVAGLQETEEILHKPLEIAHNHLKWLKEGDSLIPAHFGPAARELIAAYEFYDRFLGALASPEEWKLFPQLRLQISTARRESDHQLQKVTLAFRSDKPIGVLGTEPEQNVHCVELDFILCPADETDHTEAAFKFRTRGKRGNELTCLRTEVHARHDKTKQLPVQVDVDTVEPYSSHHREALAFGNEPAQAADNLRHAEDVLLFNITAALLGQGLLEGDARRIFGADTHDLTFKSGIFELHNEIRTRLGMPGTHAKLSHLQQAHEAEAARVTQEASEQETHAAEQEFQHHLEALILEGLSATVIEAIRTSAAETGIDGLDELTDLDLIVSLVTALPPQKITSEKLNGRLGDVRDLLDIKMPHIPTENITNPTLRRATELIAAMDIPDESAHLGAMEGIGWLATVAETMAAAHPQDLKVINPL